MTDTGFKALTQNIKSIITCFRDISFILKKVHKSCFIMLTLNS